MTWILWGAVASAALLAALHLLLVVPRLPRPEPDGDDPPPDYRLLARPWAAGLVAAAAASAALLVLPRVPEQHHLLWVAYIGGGSALVWVDLRTTWLPRILNHLVLVQVLTGVAVLALADWRTALAATGGGLAAFTLFHLVWRLGTGLGYGDVRLAGTVGIVAGTHGLQHWFTAVLAATVTGALWAVVHALRHRRTGPAVFPYGPALWLGPLIATALAGQYS